MKHLMLATALFLTCASAMAGHHLNGTWKLSVDVGGQTGVATFELKEGEGGVLTGTYTGIVGTQPVSGKVNGAEVEFGFDSPQAGKVTYVGTYADGKLSGKCSYAAVGAGTFEGTKAE